MSTKNDLVHASSCLAAMRASEFQGSSYFVGPLEAEDTAFIAEFVDNSIAKSARIVAAHHYDEEVEQAAKRAMSVAMRAHRMRESKAEREEHEEKGFAGMIELLGAALRTR